MDDATARRLVREALAPAVRLVCDLRLLVVLALALSLLYHGATIEVLVLLLAVPWNAHLLFRWGRGGEHDGAAPLRLVLLDALGVSLVCALVLTRFPVNLPVGLGYLVLSALLVGVVLSARRELLWAVVAAAPVVVALLAGRGEDPAALLMMLIGALAVAQLGRRMRRQLEQVEGLVLDVAEARAARAAAEERLVIARDLHDTVTKSAAGVRMLAENLSAELDGAGAPQATAARTLFDAADETSREARAVLHELRSEPTGDLRECLARNAATWGRRTSTPTTVDILGTPLSADAPRHWHVQRMLGELLANIERHACASRVDVRILGDDERLTLVVEDDGRGLPEEVLACPSALATQGHYGLSGLAERVSSLDGSLRLARGGQGGTRVRITVPVVREEDSQ